MSCHIRDEQREDADAIRGLTKVAFTKLPSTGDIEVRIVDRLRNSNALTISLVATLGENIIGHVAFSAVQIDGETSDWYGLGPVSVSPEEQRKGVGSALIHEGLSRLRNLCGSGTDVGGGCVVLGDPDYYRRFGFEADMRLTYEAAPAQYFMSLAFGKEVPEGVVTYHEAFSTA